jgi:hypothetical protein
MRNPFGWILGFLWFLAVKVSVKLHPEGGGMWMPNWIQPYWMRCMGFQVNEDLLKYYREKK